MCISIMTCGGHTHVKKLMSKRSLVSQGKIISNLDMCLTLRSLLTPFLPIGVGNKRSLPIKEGPSLKPNSSKLGTCEGRNSFTLAYQTLFQNWHFWMFVASPIMTPKTCPNLWARKDLNKLHCCIFIAGFFMLNLLRQASGRYSFVILNDILPAPPNMVTEMNIAMSYE